MPILRDENRDKIIQNVMEARTSNDAVLMSLATELAMGINDASTILKNHGLDRQGFERIAQLPRFQQLLTEANLAWNSSEKATTRIRVKMETALEQALPHLFKELIGEGLTGAKVELIKAIMKGTGIGEEAKGGVAVGSGVKIVINTGAPEKKTVTIDHDAEDA